MLISIAGGVMRKGVDTSVPRDYVEVVKLIKSVGFEALDVGFLPVSAPGYLLEGDDWQKRIERIGETAAQCNLVLGQAHLPTPAKASFDIDPDFKKPGFAEYYDQCLRRSIAACAMLGITNAVVHPVTYLDSAFSRNLQKERNIRYYTPYVELALQHGVNLNFENMRPDSPEWSFCGRYCQSFDDLIELVDSFGDSRLGICWDTGHANHVKTNQGLAIRTIGSRLRTLHLNDNHYNKMDEHMLPYMGQVDWNDVLSALVDVDYRGNLNLEVGVVTRKMPSELQELTLPYIAEHARALRRMYERIKETRGK
jgi:sugar phosphate isomerase/epimerase